MFRGRGGNFNPRTPRGVRLSAAVAVPVYLQISIRAPLAGCDQGQLFFNPYIQDFNPRTPRGVRQFAMDLNTFIHHISIRAPLAGCDENKKIKGNPRFDFNPRTPRGVRLVRLNRVRDIPDFNPRTPRGVRPLVPGSPITFSQSFQSAHPSRGATRSKIAD